MSQFKQKIMADLHPDTFNADESFDGAAAQCYDELRISGHTDPHISTMEIKLQFSIPHFYQRLRNLLLNIFFYLSEISHCF